MEFFHNRFEVMSRLKKNTVSYLASVTGTNLDDSYRGQNFNYEKTQRDVFLLIPKSSKFKWTDSILHDLKNNKSAAIQKLSDRFEISEKRKDAQVYRVNRLGLHKTFNSQENIQLVIQYIRDNFVDIGMLALLCFNFQASAKSYCHILLSTRRVNEEGFSKYKERQWNHRTFTLKCRLSWASLQNDLLTKKGSSIRVDARSYEAQGIAFLPLPHLGSPAKNMALRGEVSPRYQRYLDLQSRNAALLQEHPKIIVETLEKFGKEPSEENVHFIVSKYMPDHEAFLKRIEWPSIT